jgi:hypothetical protein
MTEQQVRAPAGLGKRGRALWRTVLEDWDLEAPERNLLHEAARTLDEIDAMLARIEADGWLATGSTGQPVAHPLVAAVRSHRATLAALLQRLNLPADAAEPAAPPEQAPADPVTSKARRAADARWRVHNAEKRA